MKPFIGVFCIGQITKKLSKAIESLNLDADFVFSDSIDWSKTTLPDELMQADVLLSSGYLSVFLSKITDKPIINIEPSLFDILLAYSYSLTTYKKPFIILPSSVNTSRIAKLQNLMSAKISVEQYDTLDSIDDIILKHKSDGYDCLIGSGFVCDRATFFGISSVFVYPQETIESFICLAYDTAYSICQKTEKNQQLDSIFQYSEQGIIFTDAFGNIAICNKIAEHILLKKHEQLTKMRITDFFPMNQLQPVFQNHEQLNYLICSFNEKQYIASAIPIIAKDELNNVMVTLSNIHTIQKQERHIRNTIALKGFVSKYNFENIISYSREFKRLVKIASKFSESDDNIVIFGETGTGKEVLAQSIHNQSKRSEYPFVAVNCSAITENLLESELFGYDEGAFTGAKKGGKQGYFEIAHKGTIFLDEISELSISLQSKLLRVIQEQQIVHVGGNKIINFDARIIVATNRNLWELVQQKLFREDLYYRLAVLELEIPPLRDRAEDILPLFLNFVAKKDNRFAVELEKDSQKLNELLCSYSWPGNVREIENFVKMIMVKKNIDKSNETFWDILENEITYRKNRCHQPYTSTANAHKKKRKLSVDEEMERIEKAIKSSNGNYSKAAELLGISRVTLWRKLKKADYAK